MLAGHAVALALPMNTAMWLLAFLPVLPAVRKINSIVCVLPLH